MTTADRSAKNQTLYFSVPLDLAARIEVAAKARGISPSALLCEVFRAWETWEAEENRERETKALVAKAIAEVEEEKRTNPKTPEELLADFEALHNEWSEHNRKLGISYTEDEIVEMIREDRKRGRRRKRALQHLSPPVSPETPGMPGQP